MFERRYGPLTSDLRDYFSTVNGFKPGGDQDSQGFSFWPLEKVAPVTESVPELARFVGADRSFVFADYMSLSWAYAFQLGAAAGESILIVGTRTGEPKLICSSFREFAERYMRDDESLYPR